MDGTIKTMEEAMENTTEETVKETGKRENILKKFECPFLWGIRDEVIQDFDLNDDYSDDDCSEGFIKLMKFITKAFILCQRGLRRDAMKVICTVEKRIWNKCDKRNLKDEKISIDVVNHILRATKYYIYVLNGKDKESKRLFVHIQCSSKFRHRMEQATLHGCKSIIMSFFYEDTVIETIHHAIVAKIMEPNTALWHFMLGKSLRRLRRSKQGMRPDAEEKQAFIRAEQLDSANPEYAIYVAQMLLEDNRRNEALAKYRKIKDMLELSNHVIVKMRLVIGFMKCKRMNLAKKCLDEMDRETSTKNPMLMFYKGLYLMKKNQFEDASNCFWSAADSSKILSAYLHSLHCQNKYIKNFDPVPQLLSIMHLYKKNPVNSQIILIRLGITYYRQNLLDIALGCFLQAIKLNCLGKNLRDKWEIIIGKPLTLYESVLHIWSTCQRNSEEILIVVNQELYQNDDPMWLLKESDIRKILIFCEIITGRKHIEKSRIILSVGTGIEVPGMPPAKYLVKFNKNDDGILTGAEWYHYDKVYGYRRIHERTKPGANENIGDNNDNVHDPEIHKLCPASPSSHSDWSSDWDTDSGPGDDITYTGKSDENGNDFNDGDANGHPRNSNTESSDDTIDTSTDVSELGDANAGPRNENSHSADDCAENGNLTGNSRNNGDNERIDTPGDGSGVGDAKVGPQNENENEHYADDCAENGNQNDSASSDGYDVFSDSWIDSSEVDEANVGPQNENENEHSADDCAENGNQNDNTSNDGDNELSDNSGTVYQEDHDPWDICTRPTCTGMKEVLIRIVKERFRVYLNNH